MKPAKPPEELGFLHPVTLTATWCGAGLLPGAPGSWGSLAALPFAWGITLTAGPWGLLMAAFCVFIAGCWAAAHYSRCAGQKDCQHVVIDEVAGQWIALSFAPVDPFVYFWAFFLFRVLDIFKPWPANLADRVLSGGWGIMLDDVIAGTYAALALHLGLYAIGLL
ncbi:MAG: phosphatidylglycerophosphatase A [Pseudomonadota bacterium]